MFQFWKLSFVRVLFFTTAVTSQYSTLSPRPCFGFECHEDKICIPNWLVCDGITQCADGSDELGCPTTTTRKCPAHECANGNCIPWPWICDGQDDCGDNSDEADCPEPSTYPCTEFECPNGACIPYSFLCDGDNDCSDWFDEGEESCPCADNEIRCPQIPGNPIPSGCIPPENICDEEGIWDCPDGWDESNCTSYFNTIGEITDGVELLQRQPHQELRKKKSKNMFNE